MRARDLLRLSSLFRGAWQGMRLVAVSGEQARHRDVFVQRLPVKPSATDPARRPLFWSGPQEPGEPGERDAEPATVGQIDPYAIVVESDSCRSSRRSHSTPSR